MFTKKLKFRKKVFLLSPQQQQPPVRARHLPGWWADRAAGRVLRRSEQVPLRSPKRSARRRAPSSSALAAPASSSNSRIRWGRPARRGRPSLCCWSTLYWRSCEARPEFFRGSLAGSRWRPFLGVRWRRLLSRRPREASRWGWARLWAATPTSSSCTARSRGRRERLRGCGCPSRPRPRLPRQRGRLELCWPEMHLKTRQAIKFGKSFMDHSLQ